MKVLSKKVINQEKHQSIFVRICVAYLGLAFIKAQRIYLLYLYNSWYGGFKFEEILNSS